MSDLIFAAKNGYYCEIQSLIASGYSIFLRDTNNATALYWGACRGHPEICYSLIKAGSDVNARVSWGSTPLHASADRGHTECVKILLSHGSDANLQNNRGDTPLHISAYRGYSDIVQLLLEAGAEVNIQNNQGKTCLQEANAQRHLLVSELLSNFIQKPKPEFSSPSYESMEKPQLKASDGDSSNYWKTNVVLPKISYSDVNISTNNYPNYLGLTSFENKLSFTRKNEPQENSEDGDENFVGGVNNAMLCDVQTNQRDADFLLMKPGLEKNTANEMHHKAKFYSNVEVKPIIKGEVSLDLFHKSTDSSAKKFSDFNNHIFCSKSRVKSEMDTDCSTPVSKKLQEQEKLKVDDELCRLRTTIELLHNQLETSKEEQDSLSDKIAQTRKEKETATERCRTLALEVIRLRGALANTPDLFQLNSPANGSLKNDADLCIRYKVSPISSVRHLKPELISTNKHLFRILQESFAKDDRNLVVLLRDSLLHRWSADDHFMINCDKGEWILGEDYEFAEMRPINQTCDESRDGSCSLIFQILHQKQNLILKMMINLIDLHFGGHGQGSSLHPYLHYNFGAEYEIPLRIPRHKNIIRILHHYEGSTEHFQSFMHYLIPRSIDRVEMAWKTTFLVLPEYPMSLKAFMADMRSKNQDAPYGLHETFILQLLYQLLSAVNHLQKHSIVHRDIKADNIFLDWKLRPVLGDFGFARSLCNENGEKYMFTNVDQISAGNSHAWSPELTRIHRSASVLNGVSLSEIYNWSDGYAVSRMWYSLLRPLYDQDAFPQSSLNKPHYSSSEIPQLPSCFSYGLRHVLNHLVLDNPEERLHVYEALISIGLLMFKPHELKGKNDVYPYLQSKMLQLMTLEELRCVPTNRRTAMMLSVEESICANSLELESDFLSSVTVDKFWSVYQMMVKNNLFSV